MSDEWEEYDNASRGDLDLDDPPKEPENPTEVKEVVVIKEVPVEKEVIKKIIVEKEIPVIKEVIKEVPVEKIIYRDPKPGTKIAAKEFDIGKALMFVVGGFVLLGLLAGGFWIKNQEWKNIFEKPKVVTIKSKSKPIVKWKTKWKTRVVKKSNSKEISRLKKRNAILKENLATSYARINSLIQSSNRPVQCRFKHNIRIVKLRSK